MNQCLSPTPLPAEEIVGSGTLLGATLIGYPRRLSAKVIVDDVVVMSADRYQTP